MEVFIEEVDLPSLLEEVGAIIRPLVVKSGNTLELRVAKDIGSMRTDRTKVKQCLLNVLSNASKFTQNGKLMLAIERTDRAMVQMMISDSGIGMSAEQLGRIFQAFSQADASTTKKFGGTGLGLAITRHFCRLLGGDISVASRVGEGSTFTIIIPDLAAELPQSEATIGLSEQPIRRRKAVQSRCWSSTTMPLRGIC